MLFERPGPCRHPREVIPGFLRDPRHFFSTVESAVAAFQQDTGADWPPVT